MVMVSPCSSPLSITGAAAGGGADVFELLSSICTVECNNTVASAVLSLLIPQCCDF